MIIKKTHDHTFMNLCVCVYDVFGHPESYVTETLRECISDPYNDLLNLEWSIFSLNPFSLEPDSYLRRFLLTTKKKKRKII